MGTLRLRIAAAIAGALLSAACASNGVRMPRLAEMDHVREAPAAKEAAELAPQAYAVAEAERESARKAQAAGDLVASLLYADRAIAAYGHAFVLARLARATRQNDDAQAALATAAERARELTVSRQEVDLEGEGLEKQLAVAREAQPLVPSGPTDGKREMARLVAARSLAAEAHLLCGAARLVSADAAGLADVEKEVDALEAQIDAKPHPAPIDQAARVRAKCLERLTTARRGASNMTGGDALLAALSASGGLAPERDERGVVVTLRGAFEGTSVAKSAQGALADLGRVAAAHPELGVQVVVHDATTPSKAEADADAQRADAVVKALVAAGAAVDHVKGEAVGARAPVVDPSDLAHRARNARVDVVFVTR
jgi:outer membrane protein OmpA-like peptidoglycan-associated protein